MKYIGTIIRISALVGLLSLVVFGFVGLIRNTKTAIEENNYRICQSGWGASCIYAVTYEIKEGCVFNEIGETLCGNFSIKEF